MVPAINCQSEHTADIKVELEVSAKFLLLVVFLYIYMYDNKVLVVYDTSFFIDFNARLIDLLIDS